MKPNSMDIDILADHITDAIGILAVVVVALDGSATQGVLAALVVLAAGKKALGVWRRNNTDA